MASLIYNGGIDSALRANIDFDAGSNIGVLLVTSSYTPNVDTHLSRSDITNEVANGNGYTTGGVTGLTATVTKDNANDRVDITLPGTSWASSTITARAAVYFKSTGTASTDLLIAYIDFGSNVSSTNATFTLNSSTLRYTNNNAA